PPTPRTARAAVRADRCRSATRSRARPSPRPSPPTAEPDCAGRGRRWGLGTTPRAVRCSPYRSIRAASARRPRSARRDRADRDRERRNERWEVSPRFYRRLQTQVLLEFERGDLAAVVLPLPPLVAQEVVEDMLAEGFGDELGL